MQNHLDSVVRNINIAASNKKQEFREILNVYSGFLMVQAKLCEGVGAICEVAGRGGRGGLDSTFVYFFF